MRSIQLIERKLWAPSAASCTLADSLIRRGSRRVISAGARANLSQPTFTHSHPAPVWCKLLKARLIVYNTQAADVEALMEGVDRRAGLGRNRGLRWIEGVVQRSNV